MTEGYILVARRILKQEEGFREVPYVDTEGYPTVGYGLKIGYKMQPLEDYQAFPVMPEDVAELWMEKFIRRVDDQLKAELGGAYVTLGPCRRAVLISMGYQMGLRGLLGFKLTLAAIAAGDFELAADNMIDSRWAEQTPHRAARHAFMMKTGSVHDDYIMS